jgi:hypothetical protein
VEGHERDGGGRRQCAKQSPWAGRVQEASLSVRQDPIVRQEPRGV